MVTRTRTRGLALVGLALVLALLSAFLPVRADPPTISNVYLMGPGGVGGTVTLGSTLSTTAVLGNSAGVNYWQLQSFHPVAGVLYTFSIRFSSSVGTPSGDVTWIIYSNNDGAPGTSLLSGTWTPTVSALNTVTVGGSLYLTDDLYWLELEPSVVQSSGVYWRPYHSTLNEYTGGHAAYTVDNGAIYRTYVINDLVGSVVTTSGVAPANLLNDFISQSFTLTVPTVISGIGLDLRKYNSPAGTMTLTVEYDAGDQRSGINVSSDALVTLAESGLTTSFVVTVFTFPHALALPPGRYWWVWTTDRTDATNYVALAVANTCTAQTSLKVHVEGTWQSLTQAAIWQPVIDSIQPVATEAPNLESYISLPGGHVGGVGIEFSAGEGGIALVLLAIFVLLAFGTFINLRRKR